MENIDAIERKTIQYSSSNLSVSAKISHFFEMKKCDFSFISENIKTFSARSKFLTATLTATVSAEPDMVRVCGYFATGKLAISSSILAALLCCIWLLTWA